MSTNELPPEDTMSPAFKRSKHACTALVVIALIIDAATTCTEWTIRRHSFNWRSAPRELVRAQPMHHTMTDETPKHADSRAVTYSKYACLALLVATLIVLGADFFVNVRAYQFTVIHIALQLWVFHGLVSSWEKFVGLSTLNLLVNAVQFSFHVHDEVTGKRSTAYTTALLAFPFATALYYVFHVILWRRDTKRAAAAGAIEAA
ncbi:hypothetical protein H9P43_002615 [Blastocladiella emersonii ATCC 22665]|nr:hypothetical protein H9P43_002615 [Blastocladiella emersonii ATCC 22665]